MAKRKGAAAPAETTPSFEEAIARLEQIVRELEESDLPLERALAVFEEGVRLSRQLHERLNEAEKRVEILLKSEQGGTTVAPFATEAGAVAVEDEDEDDDEAEETGSGPGQTGFRF